MKTFLDSSNNNNNNNNDNNNDSNNNNNNNNNNSSKQKNEVLSYLNGHYVGHLEALGYLKATTMCHINPTVTRLAVHLEDGNLVYWNNQEDLEKKIEKGAQSTLLAWFESNTKCKNKVKGYEGLNTLSLYYISRVLCL